MMGLQHSNIHSEHTGRRGMSTSLQGHTNPTANLATLQLLSKTASVERERQSLTVSRRTSYLACRSDRGKFSTTCGMRPMSPGPSLRNIINSFQRNLSSVRLLSFGMIVHPCHMNSTAKRQKHLKAYHCMRIHKNIHKM